MDKVESDGTEKEEILLRECPGASFASAGIC